MLLLLSRAFFHLSSSQMPHKLTIRFDHNIIDTTKPNFLSLPRFGFVSCSTCVDNNVSFCKNRSILGNVLFTQNQMVKIINVQSGELVSKNMWICMLKYKTTCYIMPNITNKLQNKWMHRDKPDIDNVVLKLLQCNQRQQFRGRAPRTLDSQLH